MDFQNTDLRGGSLQISTEVIGKIARCAALEIDGVAEVSCGCFFCGTPPQKTHVPSCGDNRPVWGRSGSPLLAGQVFL